MSKPQKQSEQKQETQATEQEARITMTLPAHTSNNIPVVLKNEKGETIHEYEGELPKNIFGEDESSVTIDLVSGQIVGWNKDVATSFVESLSKEEKAA